MKHKKALFTRIEPYMYLVPAMLSLGLFTYYPFFKTLFLSFTLTNNQGNAVEFIGLQNYIDILKSPAFYNDIAVTFKLVALVAIPSMLLGLFLAVLASEKIPGIRLFETAYSIPMAVSSSSLAVIWSIIFHPTVGIVNSALKLDIGWNSDPNVAIFTIAMMAVWLNLGINFIFMYTAFKNVSGQILESAKVDGLGFFSTLFKMKIPLISPTLFFLFFINIINSFQLFAPIHILTRGGPANSTNSLVYSIYQDAFFNNRFDVAVAKSVILFVIMLVFGVFQFKFEKKGVHYK